MLSSLRKNGLDSLFKEVGVLKEIGFQSPILDFLGARIADPKYGASKIDS